MCIYMKVNCQWVKKKFLPTCKRVLLGQLWWHGSTAVTQSSIAGRLTAAACRTGIPNFL